MNNPIQVSIQQPDGTVRAVIVEPILHTDSDHTLRPTGTFKVYKDAFGDQTHLFTEPAERDAPADNLSDEQNPDYLGTFVFENGSLHHFEGQVLSLAEQSYLAVLIESDQEPDK